MRDVTAAGRCLQQFVQGPDLPAAGLADERRRVLALHEAGDGGCEGGQVDDVLTADRGDARAVTLRVVDARDEGGPAGVLRQDGAGGERPAGARCCRFHDALLASKGRELTREGAR